MFEADCAGLRKLAAISAYSATPSGMGGSVSVSGGSGAGSRAKGRGTKHSYPTMKPSQRANSARAPGYGSPLQAKRCHPYLAQLGLKGTALSRRAHGSRPRGGLHRWV